MLVSLHKSIPYVVKSIPLTSIRGEWLADEINKCITVLKDLGFFVRAVICDDHSANVKAFRCLMKKYDGDSKLFIYHPSYEGTMKTCLFFDIIHLTKNVRNNLLNRKFVFPEFSCNLFRDEIHVPAGFISWNSLYKVYEKDETLVEI